MFGPGTLLDRTVDGARDVRAADLDGDGDLDLLAAARYDDQISWFENLDGLGDFGPERVITSAADFAQSVCAADLDGDGDPDVLSASAGDDTFAWHENLGGGAFGPRQVISSSSDGAWWVLAADLDGDGDADVLGASRDDDTVAWFENTDGAGSFGAAQVLTTTADGVRSAFAGDLDGDGDLDVLAASIDDDTVAWFENTDGLGGFGSAQVLSSAANGASTVHAADLDGDGDLDALFGALYDHVVGWHENLDGLGTFGPAQTMTSPFLLTPQAVSTADVDDDGDPDFLVAASGSDLVGWFENVDGLGTFGPLQVFTRAGDGPTAVEVVDLDGDGDLDVISACEFDDSVSWLENPGGGSAVWTRWILSVSLDGGSSVHADDLDGDGDLDLLATAFWDGKVYSYRNIDGLGTLTPWQDLSPPLFAPHVRDVYAADIDGDGDVDALSASDLDDRIIWYPNSDGLGTFGPGQVITSSANGAWGVFAADLDGDGDQDVLSASFVDDKLAWYENLDGAGTFGQQIVLSDQIDGAVTVTAADLDGDGDIDVVGAGSVSGSTVVWFENLDGRGSFGAGQALDSPAFGSADVAAVDVDSDGDADILVSGGGAPSLSWLENTDGLGTFGPAHVIHDDPQIYVRGISASDLDGDGDPDVLAAIYAPLAPATTAILWFENTDGQGTFGSAQHGPSLLQGSPVNFTITGSDLVVAADLDGDGDADIATVLNNQTAWYENRICCSLTADVTSLSLAAGGTQTLTVDAGPAKALDVCWILTTAAGDSPGIAVDVPPLKLPLNFGSLLLFSALNPNLLVAGSLSLLDASGRTSASLALAPGLDPSLAGVTLHHAYFVQDQFGAPLGGISNAVPLTLTP